MTKTQHLYNKLARLSVRQQFSVIFIVASVVFLLLGYVLLNLQARSQDRADTLSRIDAMVRSAIGVTQGMFTDQQRLALLNATLNDAGVACAEWVDLADLTQHLRVGRCEVNTLSSDVVVREEPTDNAGALIRFKHEAQTALAYPDAWPAFALLLAFAMTLGLAVSLMLHYNVLRTMTIMRNHFTRNAYGELPQEIPWARGDEFGKLIEEYNNFVSRHRGQYEALNEQLGLLETLLQTVPHPITYHNRKFELMGCNQAFVTTMNVNLKNLTGLDLDYVLPNSPWSEAQRLVQFEAHSELTTFETEYTSVLHGDRFGLFSIASYLNHQGELAGYICVLQDITDLKRTEQALKSATHDFKAIIRFLPVGIIVINNDGKTELVNEEYVNMFGYSHEEIPTLEEWSRKAYPDPSERERGNKIRQEIKMIANETGAIAGPYVRPVTCKDGSVVQVEFKYYQLDNRGLWSATVHGESN